MTRFSMPKLTTLVLALAVAASSAACGGAAGGGNNGGDTPTSGAQEVRSQKQRVTDPQVDDADKTALVDGNTAFALDLYKRIADTDGNLFYSPFSISEALAMAYAGADGQTATEMAQVMHYDLPQDRLHPAYDWLDLQLMDLGQTPVHQESEPFQLSVANSIWGQGGYHFEPDFLDTLAMNYGAGLRVLDFQRNPEASRKTINDRVANQTHDRITKLLPQGSVTDTTRMVLTNAIYFKASWLNAFEEDATAPGDFHRVDGSTVTADLMHQTSEFAYADMGSYKAVELPYDGGDVSMLVFLPDDLAGFEQSFSPATIDDTVAALSSEYVQLTLPKFEFTVPLSLTQILKDMGMPHAFQDADFSGMTGTRDLAITDVVHKAFVSVDEQGTEAAAATGVVAGSTSVPPPPVPFTADKPFVFVIRANQTGSLLFVGRVVDPTT